MSTTTLRLLSGSGYRREPSAMPSDSQIAHALYDAQSAQTQRSLDEILTMALTAVGNMAHRGGIHADGKSGDGAGVLTQIPRAFFARELARLGSGYPVADLAVGMVFLPRQGAQRTAARELVAQGLAAHGLTLLGWRPVPVDESAAVVWGRAARTMLRFEPSSPAKGSRSSAPARR